MRFSPPVPCCVNTVEGNWKELGAGGSCSFPLADSFHREVEGITLASSAVAVGCLAREGRGHPTPRCERCPWKEGFCGPAWVRGCRLPRLLCQSPCLSPDLGPPGETRLTVGTLGETCWGRQHVSLKRSSLAQMTCPWLLFHMIPFPRNPSGPYWGLRAARHGWDQK